MGRKWVLVEDDSNKVVVWLCALLGQESVMHDDEEITVFCFNSTKEELTDTVCSVCEKTNKTDVDSKCTFIDVVKFNDISNPLQDMDNMVVLLDIELGGIQKKSDFDGQSEQKTFWLNCIHDKTKKNVICIASTESNPDSIIESCDKPDRMIKIGTVHGNLKEITKNKEKAQDALQQADEFWHSLNGPKVLLSALKEAQNITNGNKSGAHPKSWPPEFENEETFPFVNLLKHKDDSSSTQALQAFKALFEFPDHQQGIELCEKPTVLGGVWCCKSCRPLTVKHIADMLEKAGTQCTYNPDVETKEINLPTMPGVVFLWRLAKFLLEGLDEWDEKVDLRVDDNGGYLLPCFILPMLNHCYHDFIASYHVRGNHQGAGVLAFEDLLCCRLPESSEGFNGGDIKHVNDLGGNCSKIGTRLVPLIRHEFRDEEIYISWVSRKFKKAEED